MENSRQLEILIAERLISLPMVFAAAWFLIYGTSTSMKFFMNAAFFNIGAFCSATAYFLQEYVKNSESRGKGLFPSDVWNKGEVIAFWMERIGVIIHIVCLFLVKHLFAVELACAVAVSVFPLATLIYLISAIISLTRNISSNRKSQKDSQNSQTVRPMNEEPSEAYIDIEKGRDLHLIEGNYEENFEKVKNGGI